MAEPVEIEAAAEATAEHGADEGFVEAGQESGMDGSSAEDASAVAAGGGVIGSAQPVPGSETSFESVTAIVLGN